MKPIPGHVILVIITECKGHLNYDRGMVGDIKVCLIFFTEITDIINVKTVQQYITTIPEKVPVYLFNLLFVRISLSAFLVYAYVCYFKGVRLPSFGFNLS